MRGKLNIDREFIAASDRINEDRVVQEQDPLNMDSVFPGIHRANANRNLNELIEILITHIPDHKQLASFDEYQSAAAMRDLGILLGSIKKLGVEPVQQVPALAHTLQTLGKATRLPPRDTLIHYTRWNPDGNRLRTYTHLKDEVELIQSVKISIYPLYQAIYLITQLNQMPVYDETFVESCYIVEESFAAMVQGIVHARKHVDPGTFANELRYYFDPITINGQEYIGPGAVEMPMFVYDHVLWSADYNNEKYNAFKETYLPFNQEEIITLYRNTEKSLTGKVINDLNNATSYNRHIHGAAHAVNNLMLKLKGFRAPHLRVADNAYRESGDGIHKEEGSGGYAPDFLRFIMQLNNQATNHLQSQIAAYEEKWLGSTE